MSNEIVKKEANKLPVVKEEANITDNVLNKIQKFIFQTIIVRKTH